MTLDLFDSKIMSADISEYFEVFRELISTIGMSKEHHGLLRPLDYIEDVDVVDQPLITSPIDEKMVIVNPKQAAQSHIYPRCAYWQLGWDLAQPFIAIRSDILVRLNRVMSVLREISPNLTIHIMDGWRPVELQSKFYDVVHPGGHIPGTPLYINPPETKPNHASPHNTGGTVDILIGVDDVAVAFGTTFDCFDFPANTAHFETANSSDKREQSVIELVRDVRRVLVNVMVEAGFIVSKSEWWHFERGTRRWASITGKPAFYGRAEISPELLSGVEPVSIIPGSPREQIFQNSKKK